MNSGVYAILDKRGNGIYVGSSCHVDKRKKEHFSNLAKNKHRNTRLQNIFNKTNIDNFEFVILTYCDREQLIAKEQAAIDFFGFPNLLNLRPKADSSLGVKHPPEFGEAISKRQLGRKATPEAKAKMAAYQLGKKRSPEHIEILRKTHTGNKYRCGHKMSDEQKKRISDFHRGHKYNVGKKASDETKAKMSKSRIGLRRSEETKKKMSLARMGRVLTPVLHFKFYNPEGVLIEGDNLALFARTNNLNASCLHKVMVGKMRHYKGWRLTPEIPPRKPKRGRIKLCSKKFEIINPEGNLISGENIKQFSEDNNLNYRAILRVLLGKQASWQGWRKAP